MVAIHAEATADYESIVLVAGGSPEDLGPAAKTLETLTPLFSKSDPPGALLTPLTWSAAVQLSAAYGPDFHPGPRLQGWSSAQATLRTAPPAIDYRPPVGITPYPWQLDGAAMIAAVRKALITDEPGTGKTGTAILGLVERWSRWAPEGPAIVVCPASVVDSWVEAWQTWAPHVRVVAWRGPKRKALAGTADVYVASYDVARADAGVMTGNTPLLDLHASALVIDECHLLKNHLSQRSQAVRRIGRELNKDAGPTGWGIGTVVALSGTPITHHPGDLWATLDAMEHHAQPAKERWIGRYCNTLPGDYNDEVLGLDVWREPEFRLTLLGQTRRVAKADVLEMLPTKVYSTRTVDLPSAWRKVYDDFEEQMIAELPDGEELNVMSVLSKLTHLSSLASAAADVRYTYDTHPETGEERQHVHLDLKNPSWKVDALLDILTEREVTRAPVVAFTPSRQLAELAGKAAAAGHLKRRVGYIIGGQTAKTRTQTVDAFQAGDLDLICATTGAGGVGITLTAADTVVFLQRPWALVESIQSEDRCHRIGSERHDSIEIIDILARNTLDTRIRAVLRERAGQLADLVQDPRLLATLLGGHDVQEIPATPTRRTA